MDVDTDAEGNADAQSAADEADTDAGTDREAASRAAPVKGRQRAPVNATDAEPLEVAPRARTGAARQKLPEPPARVAGADESEGESESKTEDKEEDDAAAALATTAESAVTAQQEPSVGAADDESGADAQTALDGAVAASSTAEAVAAAVDDTEEAEVKATPTEAEVPIASPSAPSKKAAKSGGRTADKASMPAAKDGGKAGSKNPPPAAAAAAASSPTTAGKAKPKAPPCPPSSVDVSVESPDDSGVALLTVAVGEEESSTARCSFPQWYAVELSPLPGFPAAFVFTRRIAVNGSNSGGIARALRLTDADLIPGVPYFVRARGGAAGPAKDVSVLSEAVAAFPAFAVLPFEGQQSDIYHCSAAVTLSVARSGRTVPSSAELTTGLREAVLSVLGLELDEPAAARLSSVERIEGSDTTTSRADELRVTISSLPSSTEQQTADEWQQRVEVESVASTMSGGPAWLIAELVRSKLADAIGNARKNGSGSARALQRLQRVGPIRLTCGSGLEAGEAIADASVPADDNETKERSRPSSPANSSPAPAVEAPASSPDEEELTEKDNAAGTVHSVPAPVDSPPARRAVPSAGGGRDTEAGGGLPQRSPPASPADRSRPRSPDVPPVPAPAPSRASAEAAGGGFRPPKPSPTDGSVLDEEDDERAGALPPYTPPTFPAPDDFPGGLHDSGPDDEGFPASAPAPGQAAEQERPVAPTPAVAKVHSEAFSVVGWLLSHTLVAALIVAACMGAVVYAVFFRSAPDSDFAPLQGDDSDVERGDAAKVGGGGGAGPFSALQSAGSGGKGASGSSSSSDPSLSELDGEQQYELALLKHSDTSTSGAVHFLEDVLTRLGIPSYGQSSFTTKLKDDYLSTIQQLTQLDSNDWKRLNFPVVIEEAVRKALDDRRRLLAEGGGGRGAPGSAGKAKGGGLSLKAAAPKKGEKPAERDMNAKPVTTPQRAPPASATAGSADKKEAKVKKPLVSETDGDHDDAEEDGWAEMMDF